MSTPEQMDSLVQHVLSGREGGIIGEYHPDIEPHAFAEKLIEAAKGDPRREVIVELPPSFAAEVPYRIAEIKQGVAQAGSFVDYISSLHPDYRMRLSQFFKCYLAERAGVPYILGDSGLHDLRDVLNPIRNVHMAHVFRSEVAKGMRPLMSVGYLHQNPVSDLLRHDPFSAGFDVAGAGFLSNNMPSQHWSFYQEAVRNDLSSGRRQGYYYVDPGVVPALAAGSRAVHSNRMWAQAQQASRAYWKGTAAPADGSAAPAGLHTAPRVTAPRLSAH